MAEKRGSGSVPDGRPIEAIHSPGLARVVLWGLSEFALGSSLFSDTAATFPSGRLLYSPVAPTRSRPPSQGFSAGMPEAARPSMNCPVHDTQAQRSESRGGCGLLSALPGTCFDYVPMGVCLFDVSEEGRGLSECRGELGRAPLVLNYVWLSHAQVVVRLRHCGREAALVGYSLQQTLACPSPSSSAWSSMRSPQGGLGVTS